MDKITPNRYETGSLIVYNVLQCVIEDIVDSQIGYIVIHYVDSGDTNEIMKHELCPIDVEDFRDIPEFECDLHVDNALSLQASNNEPTLEKRRHADLTGAELDNVASERLQRTQNIRLIEL